MIGIRGYEQASGMILSINLSHPALAGQKQGLLPAAPGPVSAVDPATKARAALLPFGDPNA